MICLVAFIVVVLILAGACDAFIAYRIDQVAKREAKEIAAILRPGGDP